VASRVLLRALTLGPVNEREMPTLQRVRVATIIPPQISKKYNAQADKQRGSDVLHSPMDHKITADFHRVPLHVGQARYFRVRGFR